MAIALLYLCLSSCTSEWTGDCQAPFFGDGNSSSSKVIADREKLIGADFRIVTKYEAELTDVVIEVTFPKEITLKPKRVYYTNEIIDFANKKVTRKIDKIVGLGEESTGCAITYDVDNWSKPIEVFRKVYFRQRVKCDVSQNMPEGIYVKRSFFNVKNGRLVATADSDKYWKYCGGANTSTTAQPAQVCK